MRDWKLVVVALITIAIILAGEAYVYHDRESDYAVAVESTDSGLTIMISSDGSNEYDALVLGNGDFTPSEKCVIYYDDTYGEELDDAWHATGGRDLDQSFYVSQLNLQLANMGIDTHLMSAKELGSTMSSWIGNDDCEQSLIVVSGALPDTVYTGNDSDPILQWISMGGRLYWLGNVIGKFYSMPGGTVEVGDDKQALFLGRECVNANPSKGYSEIGNGLADALSLANNDTTYGVNTSGLADSLTAGFTDGVFSSISLVKNGNGMVCVLGGIYSNDQRSDLVQVVASGLSYCSQILHVNHGSVNRGSETITVEISLNGNVSSYIYMGGYFAVYGDRKDFVNGLQT